jgi:DNA-binding transcriptional MocR family regulator
MAWNPKLIRGPEPLALALVRALTDDITNGTLPSGSRLPTQREIADDLKIALGTVTRAFNEAEKRGLIFGDGRRGTFVGETPKGKRLLSAMHSMAISGVDLSKNHPAHAYDPDLAGVLRQIAKSSDMGRLLQYPPGAGFSHHREAGARWLKTMGFAVDPERLYLCGGAQHALTVAFGAETHPGDIVAAEEYTYPGIKAACEMLGLELVGLAMDEEGIIPDALEAACRHGRIRLLYCNPTLHNPTTKTSSTARRKEIIAIAEKHDLIIVEDEILAPLLDKPVEYFAALAPERCYYIVSTSKAVAAGLRLGFIVAPPKSRQRLVDSLQTSNLGGPPLTGEIFARWLDDGVVERTIARRRREIAVLNQITTEVLRDFDVRSHRSSYNVWLVLPDNWTSANFALEAQRRGVLVAPAEIFAVDKKTPTNAVRLSIGSISDRAELERGLIVLRDIMAGSTPKESVKM